MNFLSLNQKEIPRIILKKERKKKKPPSYYDVANIRIDVK